MAHLWMKEAEGSWAGIQLTEPAYAITSRNSLKALKQETKVTGARPSLVAFQDTGGHEHWALLSSASTDVLVNGAAMRLGLHVLRDRDAIQVKGCGAMFYSTERLAVVEPFPSTQEPVPCPRCKSALEPETPAIKCPNCGMWYHQSEDLPCWTYAERCALCIQLTALDAGYHWTPEQL